MTTKRNEKAICKTCLWWLVCAGKAYLGECRKRPPTFPAYREAVGGWPITRDDSWCAEHPDIRGFLVFRKLAAEKENNDDAPQD